MTDTRYRFCIVDVFTEQRFGGNQLAVLPHASGLTTEQMQQIAREFNFSESTFVLPPEDSSNTRQVRIFTPGAELPFAGHPNVGTAFVLATLGEIALSNDTPVRVQFEEAAGLVPITIESHAGEPGVCELKAPQSLSTAGEFSAVEVTEALSLVTEDIVTSTHPPIVASVGLEFLFVELRDVGALSRSRPPRLQALLGREGPSGIHLYTRDGAGMAVDFRARMYAPGKGIDEDPATGSANCALVALLATLDDTRDGELQWRIGQGIEMGRPSLLHGRAEKSGGKLVGAYIGGACVMVAEGTMEV